MAIVLLALGTGACGGSSASSFANAYCDLVAPCCKTAGLKTDGAQCRQLFTAFGGSSHYDAKAGDDCLAATRAASNDPDFCSSGFQPPACDGVFGSPHGSKKPGEACTQDEDCAASSEGKVSCESLPTNNTTISKCQVQIVGKAGDTPCVGTVDGNTTSYSFSIPTTDIPARGYLCNVADGLSCDSTKGCTVIPNIGETCTSSFDRYACRPDARCDTTMQKCVARTAVGAACTSTDECVAKAYCDTGTKACTATRAVGSACSDSEQCTSSSCVNGKCANDGLTDFALGLVCGGN